MIIQLNVYYDHPNKRMIYHLIYKGERYSIPRNQQGVNVDWSQKGVEYIL